MGYAESLLAEGESVLLERRQHWLALLDRSKWGIIALVAGILLLFLGSGMSTEGIVGSVRSIVQPLTLGLMLVGLAVMGWAYLQWVNDVDVLTNRRVIQVDGVINKQAIDSSLEKINDAVLSQSWVARLLKYGELDVLTAADAGISAMRRLPDAVGFKKAMVEAKHDLEIELGRGTVMPAAPPAVPTMMPGGEAIDTGDEVTSTIARLAELRDKGAISPSEFEAKKAELLRRL